MSRVFNNSNVKKLWINLRTQTECLVRYDWLDTFLDERAFAKELQQFEMISDGSGIDTIEI